MEFTGVELAGDAELAALVEKAATGPNIRWRRPWRDKADNALEKAAVDERRGGERKAGGRGK